MSVDLGAALQLGRQQWVSHARVRPMKALPKSLWAATATPAASYPPLRGEVKTDCVIVGGGFTGLSTALPC